MTARGNGTSPRITQHNETLCPQSKRLDRKHSWEFDGDDPYIVCVYCGARHDALTGRKVETNAR